MINGERGTGRDIFYERRMYFQLKKDKMQISSFTQS